MLLLEPNPKPKLGNLVLGNELVLCSVCRGRSQAARQASSHQPSFLGATADIPMTLAYEHSGVHLPSTTLRIVPRLARGLEADRPAVLPLYAHSRFGVVSQQAHIQQRAASFPAEVERRGRAPPPHVRLDHASSVPWCRQSLAEGITACPVGRADAM